LIVRANAVPWERRYRNENGQTEGRIGGAAARPGPPQRALHALAQPVEVVQAGQAVVEGHAPQSTFRLAHDTDPLIQRWPQRDHDAHPAEILGAMPELLPDGQGRPRACLLVT